VFLHFSSPDSTPLRDGDVTVRYGYLTEVVRDPSGVTAPRVKEVADRFSPCEASLSFSAPGEIRWLAVDALYPGYLPLRFRIDRAGADAPRMYELSELDPHYIPLDLKITADKKSVFVRANLRFP
jgi:hypothetical protein